jgi:hypothetical protein
MNKVFILSAINVGKPYDHIYTVVVSAVSETEARQLASAVEAFYLDHSKSDCKEVDTSLSAVVHTEGPE